MVCFMQASHEFRCGILYTAWFVCLCVWVISVNHAKIAEIAAVIFSLNKISNCADKTHVVVVEVGLSLVAVAVVSSKRNKRA